MKLKRSLILGIAVVLMAAAPRHVPTSDYWSGYAGTHTVPADVAARWLTWAEVGVEGSQQIRPFGVKTMLYTDPNRQVTGEPLYTADESTFAHDCNGNRIMAHRENQFLMDPRSRQMRDVWKRHVERYSAEGHFDAIFADDANDLGYLRSQPCNVSGDDWLRATNEQQRSLGYPVIYNGLETFDGHGPSKSIALNASSIGGMMEQCYASSPTDPKVGDWKWIATENTELRMAREGKYFFCYGNDTSPADQSIENRLYVFSSYLLTYDPKTTVLWEYYRTPSGLHIMPEVQFVPLNPVRKSVDNVAKLRNDDGLYVRAYNNCYLQGRKAGKCIVVVNPDGESHRLDIRGYSRVLSVSGSGAVDGGSVRIDRTPLPGSLAGLSSIIAVR